MSSVSIVEKDMTKIKQGVLLHGCNTKGVMGIGRSQVFRAAFPSIYQPYKSYCHIANKMGRNILGRVIETQIEDLDLYVLTGLIENNYGVDGKEYADIDAVAKVIDHAAKFASFLQIPLYMTQIGCGYGGLKWERVLPFVEKAAEDFGVEIYVCVRPEPAIVQE